VTRVLRVKGADIARALDMVIDWQLENPGSSREACTMYLVQEWRRRAYDT